MLGWVEPQSARRRRQQLIMDVPQALELMAACLGAGLPARTACAAIVRTFDGPLADDLGQVLALLQLGVADVAAWRTLHDHPQRVSRLGIWRGRWSREPQWWRGFDITLLRLARYGGASTGAGSGGWGTDDQI